MTAQKQETWISKNLIAVVGMGVAWYMGHSGATANLAAIAKDVTALERRATKLEDQLPQHRRFMGCSAMATKQAETKLKLETPCTLEVPQ